MLSQKPDTVLSLREASPPCGGKLCILLSKAYLDKTPGTPVCYLSGGEKQGQAPVMIEECDSQFGGLGDAFLLLCFHFIVARIDP